MTRKKLLIWSDAPACGTGLSRITTDVATRIVKSDIDVEVATIGYGGPGSCKLPFHHYPWARQEDWVIRELPQVWDDFVGDGSGILFAIYDIARCWWLGQIDNPEFHKDPMCQWVEKMKARKKLKLWGYFPMDATGPHGRLAAPLKQTVLGFDRVLAYSSWAQGILRASGIDNTDWLPHGIDTSVWYPRYRDNRKRMNLEDDDLLLGIVATNQYRKDWALGIQTAAYLRDHLGKKVALWLHTDVQERYWSIPTLLLDYGFVGASQRPVLLTTGDLSDDQMAEMYSAIDCFVAIGRGEGFGYPIFESLACGTPVCAHRYSGYVEHLPDWMMVDPEYYTAEGLYSENRPVGVAKMWAEHIAQYSREFGGIELPKQLAWSNLWSRWSEWLRRGI